MEAVSLAIGTTSLLSVARLCLQTANVIEAMKSFRVDLQSFYVEYHIEHVRLALWCALVLGVQPQQGANLDYKHDDFQIPATIEPASPIDLGAPLRGALQETSRILAEIKKVLEKYDKTPSFSRLVKFQTRLYKEGDRDKVKELLQKLKDWNDRLHALTSSRYRGYIATNLRSRVLASADSREQLQTIQNTSKTSYPELSSEAAFKNNLLTIDKSTMQSNVVLKVDVDNLRPSQPPPQRVGNNLRALGWVTAGSTGNHRVLQEWKFGQPDWNKKEIDLARERTDRLARMLHLDNKPQQLRSLDLIGYATKDSKDSNRTTVDFCFLYKLPPFADSNSAPTTLLESLDFLEKDRPNLAERFSLATALAESLLCFHSHNWIHKAICSTNVIFFHDGRNKQVQYSKPFIAGFEFARPDTATDRTLDAFKADYFEVFCHPDLREALRAGRSTLPRYQRQYDIYGLGVILLEIGCWMSSSVYLEAKPEDTTIIDHEFLLSICDECVPSRMGSKYRDVVKACLTWRPDDEKLAPISSTVAQEEEGDLKRNQIEEFMYTVVDALRACHCHP